MASKREEILERELERQSALQQSLRDAVTEQERQLGYSKQREIDLQRQLTHETTRAVFWTGIAVVLAAATIISTTVLFLVVIS